MPPKLPIFPIMPVIMSIMLGGGLTPKYPLPMPATMLSQPHFPNELISTLKLCSSHLNRLAELVPPCWQTLQSQIENPTYRDRCFSSLGVPFFCAERLRSGVSRLLALFCHKASGDGIKLTFVKFSSKSLCISTQSRTFLRRRNRSVA